MKKKFTQKQLNQKVLYFAYGSNLHKYRLDVRVGFCEQIATHVIPGYELIFDCGVKVPTFANIRENANESVEGVIYEMTYQQLRTLDFHEGLYERFQVDYNGRKLHVYISHFRHNTIPFLDSHYWSTIQKGALKNNLLKTLSILYKTHVLKYDMMYDWNE